MPQGPGGGRQTGGGRRGTRGLDPASASVALRPAAVGRARLEPAQVDTACSDLLARWRESLSSSPRERELPAEEALLVLEAILVDRDAEGAEALEASGRAWGRVHATVREMLEDLSHLREVLIASGTPDAETTHRAIDRVTAAAMEEVLARLERLSRTDALTGWGTGARSTRRSSGCCRRRPGSTTTSPSWWSTSTV